MLLQSKIVLLFLVLGMAFGIGSYAGLQSSLLPTFETFDRDSAEQDLSRFEAAMDAEFLSLDVLSQEYSEWDHSYDFVRGMRPQFIEENLNLPYFANIDINTMMFFDSDGRLVWHAITNTAQDGQLNLEDEFMGTLAPDHPILQHRGDFSAIAGLFQLKTAPLLMTTRPILRSHGLGPAAGTLIVGRFIDEERVRKLGRRTSVKAELRSIEDSAIPRQLVDSIDSDTEFDDSTYWEVRDDSAVGHKILTDVLGIPAFVLSVDSPRNIMEIGRNAIEAAMIFLLVATAVFLLAAWLFMRRLIVAPIAELTNYMLRIRKTGVLEQQLETDRADEIGVLATEFGQLTADLKNVQDKLKAARDQAVANSDAKSEFLARMSHEIRTPMNGVLGMVELLSNTPLDNSQKRYAQTIHESADSLLDIINDVLDFSKIEAGRLRLEELTFDLHAFLRDMVATLNTLASQKGLALVCEAPEGPSLAVRGDPFRLRQVLTNLIGNAIKFTEQGSVRLSVTATDDGAEHMNVRFAVTDSGIGISRDKQKLIFDSFSQEDGSTTRRFGGTGLGLAISKELVDMMGGELSVDSQQGTGSEFSFTLHMRASSETDFSASARSLQRGMFKPSDRPTVVRNMRGKVLLAEDNAVNQAVAVGLLASMGVEAVVAKNGSEAIEIFATQKFDAVLMDCQMPVIDGFEATEAIRKLEFENDAAATPIVALTANALVGDREKCMAAGMNDYLSKPFTGEQLSKVLSRYLADKDGAPAQEDSATLLQGADAANQEHFAMAVDPSVLDQLSALQQTGTSDLVQRVIEAYFSSSAELATQLAASIDAADVDGVRSSAHALKSSSANVGATALAEMCKELENAARQGDLDSAPERGQRILQEHEKVIEALATRAGAAAA